MRVKFLSKRPSLLKILRLVIALLVPVLILLILSFLYGYRRSAEAVSNRIDSMFAYQMEQVDASFDQINGYLTDTLLTNRYVEEIRLAEPEDIGYYRSARNLCSEVATLQSFINSGYTFYFYTPRLNLSFRSSGASEGYMTDYKVVDAVTADIDDGRYNYNDTRWQYYDVDGIGYMVQVLQNDGMYFACWIRAERIFSFFNEIIQSEEGFYAVVGESGRPLTNEGRVEELGIQLSGIHTTCDASGYDCSYVHPSHMAVGILAVDRQVLDMGDAGFYLLLVFVIFLIVLAFCLYIIYYFRRYIQEPLEFFQGHVNSYLQERKFSKRYGSAELNEVENAFSALEAQVRELKIDVYEEKIRRTRTELEFLQNQIKPHFFVNCFSILYGMAERRQYDRIQEFCLILSDYVRYLLAGSFHKVPLERELRHIQEFLTIQNIRFHAENVMTEDVDEDMLDCLIPPVTLLTFVENTVKHNKFKRDDLSVIVSAEEAAVGDGTRLRMKVADNGIGLSTEALAASRELLRKIRKAVLEGGEEPENTGEHIGLANVYRRILLLYGDGASLDITSEAEVGTVVTMTIPIERETPPPALES